MTDETRNKTNKETRQMTRRHEQRWFDAQLQLKQLLKVMIYCNKVCHPEKCRIFLAPCNRTLRIIRNTKSFILKALLTKCLLMIKAFRVISGGLFHMMKKEGWNSAQTINLSIALPGQDCCSFQSVQGATVFTWELI